VSTIQPAEAGDIFLFVGSNLDQWSWFIVAVGPEEFDIWWSACSDVGVERVEREYFNARLIGHRLVLQATYTRV